MSLEYFFLRYFYGCAFTITFLSFKGMQWKETCLWVHKWVFSWVQLLSKVCVLGELPQPLWASASFFCNGDYTLFGGSLWGFMGQNVHGIGGSMVKKKQQKLMAMKETQVWSPSRDQRSPGEGNGNLLWYSCLENPMDGGAWWATVHGVARVGHDVVTEPTSHPGPITVHSTAIFSLSQQMYQQISIALVYVSEADSPRSLTFCSLCFNRDRFTTPNISK